MAKDGKYPLLSNIDSPADLRKLPEEKLPAVCAELRAFIIESLSNNPGHFASSLGAVELTVALHYTMETPQDKIVWDVGHQAYGHKILTGRRDRFDTNRKFKGLKPFPAPEESEYDAFIGGHASNSISAALGLAVSAKMNGKENEHTIAVIGDGSMSGGLAYEGLNNASSSDNNLLIILNDNNMSIDKSVGGMSQLLISMHSSRLYNKIRHRAACFFTKIGLLNKARAASLTRFNNGLKAMLYQQQNIFEGMSVRYFGPIDGHDVIELVHTLNIIKDMKGPKLLHIHTVKGRGYEPAEKDATAWHQPGLFDIETGERIISESGIPRFQDVFGETLVEIAKMNPAVVGVTPAMPTGCSMNLLMKEMPERFFDVGIAEGHAVTFSAGLGKGGAMPFCNIYSSFMQRGYDNLIHDAALQRVNMVLCLDRAGIVGNDGATHHGLLDLAYLRHIPNMVIGAPMTAEDLKQMMILAEDYNGPIAIRYPRGRCAMSDSGCQMADIQYGKGAKLRDGKDIAVITIGAIGNTMAEAIEDVESGKSRGGEPPQARRSQEGLSIAHYDLRWLKPLDEEMLHEIGKQYSTIVTAEDGILAGGMGSAVLEWMSDHNYHPHIIRLGVNDQFVEHGSTKELYHLLNLDKEGLCESLLQALEK